MATILCITSGFAGMLNASLALGKQLQKEGHVVKYGAIKKEGSRVRKEGLDYIQLPLFREEVPPATSISRRGAWDHMKRIFLNAIQFSQRRKTKLKALNMGAFKEVLDQERPDVILVDLELHPYIFTIYALKIPFLIISQWFSGIPSHEIPPLDTLYIPHANQENKRNIKGLWAKRVQRLKKRYWKGAISSVWNNDRSILLAYAKQTGFPSNYLESYGWPTPFTYRTLPILHLNLAELEFPHQYPTNHHYIGIYVDENRQEMIDDQVMHKLEEIFKIKTQQKKKLIYCSVSTMKGGSISVLDKIIPAVERNKDWILIVGLGSQTSTNSIHTDADNIFLFNFVPQLKVLRHADCSINHGGIHTINECIYFEVPMLIYSGERYDQNGCAARVSYHQVGMLGDLEFDSIENIEERIHSILKGDRFRKNIKKLKEVAQSDKYLNNLPKLIKELV